MCNIAASLGDILSFCRPEVMLTLTLSESEVEVEAEAEGSMYFVFESGKGRSKYIDPFTTRLRALYPKQLSGAPFQDDRREGVPLEIGQ